MLKYQKYLLGRLKVDGTHKNRRDELWLIGNINSLTSMYFTNFACLDEERTKISILEGKISILEGELWLFVCLLLVKLIIVFKYGMYRGRHVTWPKLLNCDRTVL